MGRYDRFAMQAPNRSPYNLGNVMSIWGPRPTRPLIDRRYTPPLPSKKTRKRAGTEHSSSSPSQDQQGGSRRRARTQHSSSGRADGHTGGNRHRSGTERFSSIFSRSNAGDAATHANNKRQSVQASDQSYYPSPAKTNASLKSRRKSAASSCRSSSDKKSVRPDGKKSTHKTASKKDKKKTGLMTWLCAE